MNTVRRYASFGLVSCSLLALSAPLDEPAFGPEEGTSLSKEFVIGATFELDDFSAVVDGQDLGGMLGAFEVSVESTTRLAVTDEYVAVGEGRPTRLRRTFDALSSDTSVGVVTDFGGEDQELTSSSELEGLTVVFTWNEDEGAYETAFDGDGGDEDLLDGLEEEMDLRVLLPAGEVSEGDTWEVDVKTLGPLAAPGGNLSLLPDDFGEGDFEDFEVFEEMFDDDMFDDLSDLFEGSCECTYRGAREEDGTRLAEIHVAIEIGSAADLTDLLLEVMDALTAQIGEEIPVELEVADFNLDAEGEGVLLWDLDAGHVAGFEFVSEVVFAFDVALSVADETGDHYAEMSFEMSGAMEHLVEAEE